MLTVFKRTSIISLLTLLPWAANGQDEAAEAIDLPRWYQIEILIFGQNNVATEEVFRDQPFSLETNSILSEAASINALLNKQANGDAIVAQVPETDLIDTTETALQQAPLTQEAAQTPDLEADPALAPLTPEFIATKAEAYILAEHNEKLWRRRAYRVLWHGSWQQALEENGPVNEYSLSAGRLLLQPPKDAELEPETSQATDPLDALVQQLSAPPEELNTPSLDLLTEEPSPEVITPSALAAARLAEAEALVAAAPKSFRELQGSFKIYKTRFAHIELDLWFTQLDETVPAVNLPLLTIQQPPEAVAEAVKPEELEAKLLATDTVANTPAAAIANVSATDFIDDGDSLVSEDIEKLAAIPSFELAYELAYEPILYGHIKEDRRVRPEELYYVDHPLFGAIIKMVEVDHPLLRINQEDADPLAF